MIKTAIDTVTANAAAATDESAVYFSAQQAELIAAHNQLTSSIADDDMFFVTTADDCDAYALRCARVALIKRIHRRMQRRAMQRQASL